MSVNSFLKERATLKSIQNVASFCSECYSPLAENQTVFYDMQQCRYLCSSCQALIAKRLQREATSLDKHNENSGLFI